MEKKILQSLPLKKYTRTYLCLLQQQRSKYLPAATVGFISLLFAARNTVVNPNLSRHINKRICVKMCEMCKNV